MTKGGMPSRNTPSPGWVTGRRWTPERTAAAPPGPYMLDADILSTRRLAHFWGLGSLDTRHQKAHLEDPLQKHGGLTPGQAVEQK
jgi:hypothetical protein